MYEWCIFHIRGIKTLHIWKSEPWWRNLETNITQKFGFCGETHLSFEALVLHNDALSSSFTLTTQNESTLVTFCLFKYSTGISDADDRLDLRLSLKLTQIYPVLLTGPWAYLEHKSVLQQSSVCLLSHLTFVLDDCEILHECLNSQRGQICTLPFILPTNQSTK